MARSDGATGCGRRVCPVRCRSTSAAHARPSTGPNFYHDDVIGQPPGPQPPTLEQLARQPGDMTFQFQLQQAGAELRRPPAGAP